MLFNVLYKYWLNLNDTPGILFKLNLWTYINLRVFKFKFTRNILYFIQSINGFKIKNIFYNYRDWNFEHFFYKFSKIIVIFLFLLYLV